jgi:hypothetical protein
MTRIYVPLLSHYVPRTTGISLTLSQPNFAIFFMHEDRLRLEIRFH